MSVIIDISWPLSAETVSYKDRHPLIIEELRTVVTHGVQDSLCLRLHMHTGTHVDAPSHFIPGGKTIEQLPLEKMNGPCRVLDLTFVTGESIEEADLVAFDIQSDQRILLKTRNSLALPYGAYNVHEVYLGASAAKYLAACKVALVGVDALGLERDQPDYASHMALFNAEAVIVEGLRLDAVPYGLQDYVLHLLPLAFVGSEAAPARAVLTRS